MEKSTTFSDNLRHERVMKGITADATQLELIKIMENLARFDRTYGRDVALKYAKEVAGSLSQAHEILEEFITDNEAETE